MKKWKSKFGKKEEGKNTENERKKTKLQSKEWRTF